MQTTLVRVPHSLPMNPIREGEGAAWASLYILNSLQTSNGERERAFHLSSFSEIHFLLRILYKREEVGDRIRIGTMQTHNKNKA